MTASAISEAERLRRCRRVFERALRDGVCMDVARQRVAEEDWRAAEARRHRTALCGTASPALPGAAPVDPVEGVPDEQIAWWHR